MVDGFLGRWSERKQAVRQGKTLDEPVAKPLPMQELASAPDASSSMESPPVLQKVGEGIADTGAIQAPQTPPPSMQDVAALNRESDYKPFVARAVAPEVRNAAMKKLFADPHFNVMDGLDTYIDDYSIPDPLPAAMLRKMVSAKFLGLFEDDDQTDTPGAVLGDDADTRNPQTVAQSVQPNAAAPPPENHESAPKGAEHDHTDLRLQQDHAAGPAEPGRVVE